MLGSNSRRLPDLEYGKNVKVNKQVVVSEGVKHLVNDNKCTEFLSLGESQGIYL
jgi:hypothetical protein